MLMCCYTPLCDALLGRRGLGRYRSALPGHRSSVGRVRIARCCWPRWCACCSEQRLAVGNVDCTLVLERPKIMPHVPAMRAAIAPLLGVAEDAVSIKATTNETWAT